MQVPGRREHHIDLELLDEEVRDPNGAGPGSAKLNVGFAGVGTAPCPRNTTGRDGCGVTAAGPDAGTFRIGALGPSPSSRDQETRIPLDRRVLAAE
jgi:hypothetical protein